MAFQLVQTLYWLALATWFGGVLFVVLTAPIVFRTVAESRPILPTVLSVNLENQHGSLLAGSIVGNVLRFLSNVQVACAAVLLVMLVSQWFVMDLSRRNVLHGLLRSTLFVVAVAMILYDRFHLWPKVWKARQEYIDHADEPDVANPAKDDFDRYQRESERVLLILVILLSLMMLFSTVITSGQISA